MGQWQRPGIERSVGGAAITCQDMSTLNILYSHSLPLLGRASRHIYAAGYFSPY